jgi:hypothetical protein
MPSLLARLAKAKSQLLGTASKEIPVPFELACDCGHRVTGIRRANYQLATCSACRNFIYVLPVNVYPTTRRVRSEVVDGPLVSKVGTVVRELLKGDTPPEESDRTEPRGTSPSKSTTPACVDDSPGSRKNPGRRTRHGEPAAANSNAKVKSEDAAESIIAKSSVAPLVVVPRRSISYRLKRLFSPTRLLALAGVAVLIATGWYTVHQRQQEQARKTWRTEMDRAGEALKKRDLATLHESLTDALKAAHTLRRQDADVRTARSLLMQTDAVLKLSSVDLVVAFSGMVQEDGSINAAKAQAASDSLPGQLLVFEAVVRSSGSASEPCRVDVPLMIDNIPVEVRVLSPLLVNASEAMPGVPLLFVARIESGRAPADGSRVWSIVLESSSCALITTEFHANQLGFDVAMLPTVKATVARQDEFMRTQDLQSPEVPGPSVGSPQTAASSASESITVGAEETGE